MIKLWSVWCEWDIGQEGIVFTSKTDAAEWAKQALLDSGVEDLYEDIFDDLIGFSPVLVYEKTPD